MTGRRPFALWLVAVLFAALWFGTLEYRKLVKPDEGRYGEIPREMVATGDWLTPRLNGIKYFEKPPLQYWATAAAFSAFGEHHWTVRIWPALTGFLGILFSAWVAALLFGTAAGWVAASVLGGSFLYVMLGHTAVLDMSLSVFLASAVFAFVLAQRDGATPRQTRNWMWAAYALLALAVLTKGLVGLVLPGATLVAYIIWQRDWGLLKKLHLASGLALFFLIAAPWFVAVSLANPEFFNFFFIHEHFQRFLTKVHRRYAPMWYFVPILLVGLMPWTLALFGALRNAAKREAALRFQPQRFLLLWCVMVFGFFSVSSSKLVPYILPIFPALAALIGAWWMQASPAVLKWQALLWAPVGLAIVTAAPFMVVFGDEQMPVAMFEAWVPWMIAAGLGLAAASVLAHWLARRERRLAAAIALGLGGHFACQVGILGMDSIAPATSTWHISQKIRPELTPDMTFYSVGMYDQTIPFYLKRTVQMVEHTDELKYGIEWEPQKFMPTFAEFVTAWNAAPKAMAMMPPDVYQRFVTQNLPMREIARDTRRVFVVKP
ncbi:phospholipid carrier-dependent glycosyltransferase [Sulfurisoma sediminicola]|uniref:4-amino-4-deoxy-L-arabinose transferase-like glycosyltransferase n=1 Tax=Sulfurisoma sediminicola TaxID=1381557 RepID=A0A497XE67_9PROT|nr:phospholipid carrier-dependent glycosyltransferase [Sulfurisoma sediminicola]RLJ65271.1 4-amino-4-deoxy-L-arabinose transferase-like glycosyltransferase [Sulfurisoma sediminicola]